MQYITPETNKANPPVYRFIDAFIPVETCNLRCHYCYIYLCDRFRNRPPKFKYNPEQVRQALSAERLGGVCLVNMCAGGETLSAKETVDIASQLLEEGHYVMIVTNGLMTNRLKLITEFPPENRKRLFFKFSFHYLELIRTQKMELFFSNVEMMRQAGCSYTVELTTNDEIIGEIEQIQKTCMEKLGALCHVTIARDDRKSDTPLLTKYDKEEYRRIWSVFDSQLFDFKMELFQVQRKEFCYAGEWSFCVNIGTGEMSQCYKSGTMGNIFENPKEPIPFTAIGHRCAEPYCFNGHAFLALGNIPELDTPTYAEVRNRITETGEEWLTDKMRSFFERRFKDFNQPYTDEQKKKAYITNMYIKYNHLFQRIIRKASRLLSNRG